MDLPTTCPQPIFIGGFDEDVDNTDTLLNGDPSTENIIEGEETSFAARRDPNEESGPFQNQRELIMSYLKGQKPTLLLKNGDYLGGHKINLVDLFPLIFPYGMGGPDEIRSTQVSPSSVLCHYPRIALPQMQHPQFLLVLCSMWQRMESFSKCIISCKSSFKSSTLADALSELTQDHVETAARHILDGEETENETLKKLFKSIKGQCSSLGHSNEAASYARHKLFS